MTQAPQKFTLLSAGRASASVPPLSFAAGIVRRMKNTPFKAVLLSQFLL